MHNNQYKDMCKYLETITKLHDKDIYVEINNDATPYLCANTYYKRISINTHAIDLLSVTELIAALLHECGHIILKHGHPEARFLGHHYCELEADSYAAKHIDSNVIISCLMAVYNESYEAGLISKEHPDIRLRIDTLRNDTLRPREAYSDLMVFFNSVWSN